MGDNQLEDSLSEIDQEPEMSKALCKKRKSYGRLKDVGKKLRAQSHEQGNPCNCKMKCFENIMGNERSKIIIDFNSLACWDRQTIHLAGLISVFEISRRRPRQNENEASFRQKTFKYKVRVFKNDNLEEVYVCQKAFLSLHGISKKRLENIQKSLKKSGAAPTDMRGKHENRPKKLSSETKECVVTHISSFKGRESHYSMKKTQKVYLPEELNVQKMHAMYREKYPLNLVSYETYRTIFCENFNIAFGYPRSDTCSTCDQFTATVKSLYTKVKMESNEVEKNILLQQISNLEVQNKVHLKKAQSFYDRKREARKRSRKYTHTEAISMDFQKNLPCPNITTNLVYYKRQLSVYSFNIHRLSDNKSCFYVYPESVGNKGSNEVVSFLNNFINNEMSPDVENLYVFCDSAGGQNKNYSVFRYLHYLVHIKKRFKSIVVTYPVRGHSYLECDKNMGLVNTKTRTEVPEDWVNVFENARAKPEPFVVIKDIKDDKVIRDWHTFLTPLYIKKCTFKTRPIRELKFEADHPRFAIYRQSYNGAWVSSLMTNRQSMRTLELQRQFVEQGEFLHPQSVYQGKCHSLQQNIQKRRGRNRK